MKKLLFVSVILALAAGPAMADDVYWTDNAVGNSYWDDVGNWDAWTSGTASTDIVPDHIPGAVAANDWCIINKAPGSGPVVRLNQNNCYGILMDDGTMTIQDGAYVGSKQVSWIGGNAGTVGVVNMENGSTFTMNFNKNSGSRGTWIGDAGTGTLNVGGSGPASVNPTTFYANHYFRIGNQASGVGTVNVHDGAVMNLGFTTFGYFYVGYDGKGTINIDGGQINIGGRLDLGSYNGGAYTNSQGHIEMSGGQIIAQQMYMEINAQTLGGTNDVRGTIHQTGGEFIFTDAANPATALNRVNQAINQGWWTTDSGLTLVVTPYTSSTDGFTHVTVTPEPAAMILLALGGLMLRRRR